MKSEKDNHKVKDFFFRFLSIGFILVLWFLFSSPYILQGKVPYTSTYQVTHFHPWSAFEKYWGPVKNGAMPDIIDQIYPWRHFSISSLKKGSIAYWNPYSFAGNPHLANFQSTVLSPFNILFLILPFVDAWSILILLQPLLAGLFMYVFMRQLYVGKVSALISAVAYMFCGFIVVWMAYGTLSMTIAFLPLVLFGIRRWFVYSKKSGLVIMALGFPLSFFSGHFQTGLYLLIFSLVFLLYHLVQEKEKNKKMYAVLFFVLGIALSLFQIVPSVQFYSEAVRSQSFIQGGGIPLSYFTTLFAPDFYGNPVTRNDWFGFYAEWASFVGVIPLLLTAIGLFCKKKKFHTFFIVTSVITFIFIVDSPIQKFIGDLHIPVFSTSNPSRLVVLFSFCVAVLAGFGADALQETINKKDGIKRIIAPLSLLIGIFILVWIFGFTLHGVDKAVIAKRNLILPTVLLSTALMVIFVQSRIKILTKYSLLVLLLLASFDSYKFVQKWMPSDPRAFVYPDTKVVQYMQEHIGYSRAFGNFRAQVDTYYEIPGIEGYDPLYIERYGEFINAAANGTFTKAERSVVQLSRTGKYVDRVLNLLGVSLIFHPIADTNQSWAYPVWADKKRFHLVYGDNRYQVFQDTSAMERVQLFYEYEVIHDKKEILKRFYSDNFDFRKKLLLEKEPMLTAEKNPQGEASILSYTPNKIRVKVVSTSESLLFLSDNFYPLWKARLLKGVGEDTELEILRADYSFRAVKIPKGESEVEFYYSGFF